jgi:uncharacterized protein (DUF1684 family)
MRLSAFLLCLFLINMSNHGHTQSGNDIQQETDRWHARRIAALKASDGWLNLAGLHWLEEGMHSFGSDSTKSIVFPAGRIVKEAGRFERRGDVVVMHASKGSGIRVNGKKAQVDTIFSPTMTVAPACAAGCLRWTIIKRNDRIGIRLRDLEHPSLKSFKGVDRFPADSSWRVTAKLVTDPYTRSIPITNVLGQVTQTPLVGRLHFKLDGRAFVLDALQEGDELFIIFGDETSGLDTYGAGRFLYADMPDANGKTILDFNRAINPPCAFTPYATCPLPPRQNMLQVAVRAGERDFHLEKH